MRGSYTRRFGLALSFLGLMLPRVSRSSETPYLDYAVKDAIRGATEKCILSKDSLSGDQAVREIERCALNGTFESSTESEAARKALIEASKKKNSYLHALFSREAIEWDRMLGKEKVDRRFSRSIERLLQEGKLDLAETPELKRYLEANARMHAYRQTFRVVGSSYKPARCVLPDLNVYDKPESLPQWFPAKQWPECKIECRPKLVGSDFDCKPVADWPRKRNVSVKEVLPESLGVLDKCAAGLEAAKASGQILVPRDEDVCERIQNTELTPFASETTRFVSHMKVTDYFEMLRLEAVARIMAAHRSLLGRDMKTLPRSCERFRDGVEAFALTQDDSMRQRREMLLSPEFAAEARSNAQMTLKMMNQVGELSKKLSACPTHCDPTLSRVDESGVRACVRVFESGCADGYQEQIETMHQLIADSVAAFPFLGVGHRRGREPYEDLPAVKELAGGKDGEITEKILAYGHHISEDLRYMMSEFCRDTSRESVSDLLDLAKNENLTDAVLEKFPEFTELHEKCIVPELEGRKTTGKALGFSVALGSCFIPGVGLACSDVFLVQAFSDFNEAQRDLYRCSVFEGDQICTQEYRKELRERYSGAETQLGLAAAFSFGEKVATAKGMIGALRGGGKPPIRVTAGTLDIKRNSNLTLDDIAKSNEYTLSQLKESGAEVSESGSTYVSKEPYYYNQLKKNGVDPSHLDELKTYKVTRVAGKGKNSPVELALNHPEMNSYLERMRKWGFKLEVDPGMGLQRSGGHFYARANEIRIPPNGKFHDFVHEFQHLLFHRLEKLLPYDYFLYLGERTSSLEEMLSSLPPGIRESLLKHQEEGTLLESFFRSGARGIPKKAANETAAVQSELNLLKKAGFTRLGATFQKQNRYALTWQIQELEKIPAAMRTSAQAKALKLALVERYFADFVIKGGVDMIGGGAGALGVMAIVMHKQLGVIWVRMHGGGYKQIKVDDVANRLMSTMNAPNPDQLMSIPKGSGALSR
jgi:hypothetical protein